MAFGAARLEAVLEEHLPGDAAALAIAVSGGPDSACLLAALRELPRRTVRELPVRAVHIDHGLQSASALMRDAAVALCARFDTPLTVRATRVEQGAGLSLEAAAREARYRELALELAPGEVLLTAHHERDQAETLLLQLVRGAGLKGLASMPRCRPLGAGWHLRPLLEVPQPELEAYAQGRALTSVRDPMNDDLRFDRAYVRAALWPLIERRWPGAAGSIARSAAHLADAQRLLDRSADGLVRCLRDGDALDLAGLRALSASEQTLALRRWLATAGVQLPSTTRLEEALRQMLDAATDQVPAVCWGAHALRRYRGRLFITRGDPPGLAEPLCWPLAGEAPLELGAGLGRLRLEAEAGGLDPERLPALLSVRRRAGGESLRIARGARTRSLRELCQAWGVLPWVRDALPLVYAHDVLIAVGDLWHNADWRVERGAAGVVCRWDGAPPLT